MILGVGIDIVAIDRIQHMLEHRGERAIKRLYTEIEQTYCEKMARPELHFAARFAAKEAFVKALGTGFTAGLRWKDIGIVHDPKGKPLLDLRETALEAWNQLGASAGHVSLTHDPTHAGAVVVIEK